ncbi:MAG: hypothetical protein L6R40_000129 [Gallowayella cf. fulva]|nr:MAG: hypothetical protein L6R40_000129 [Xanthomendoza cf. fulva]
MSCPHLPSGILDNPWNINLDENSFYMRDHEASWYHVARRWPNTEGDYLSEDKFSSVMRSHTNLWVTHFENGFQNQTDSLPGTRIALLTRLTEESNDVKYVRSYMHIGIVRQLKAHCGMLEAAYRCAQQLTESSPAENLMNVSQGKIHTESPEYEAALDALLPEVNRIIASEENELARDYTRQRSGKDTDDLSAYFVLLFFLRRICYHGGHNGGQPAMVC